MVQDAFVWGESYASDSPYSPSAPWPWLPWEQIYWRPSLRSARLPESPEAYTETKDPTVFSGPSVESHPTCSFLLLTSKNSTHSWKDRIHVMSSEILYTFHQTDFAPCLFVGVDTSTVAFRVSCSLRKAQWVGHSTSVLLTICPTKYGMNELDWPVDTTTEYSYQFPNAI